MSTLPVATAGVEFTCYGIARPAGSKRISYAGDGRAYVRDQSPRTSDWKRSVGQAAGIAMRDRSLLDGPLRLTLAFHQPRPRGHFTGKGALRASARPYPTVVPDLTKLTRGVEDALTGIVWHDDSQVVEQRTAKLYGEPARVEVLVELL